ncbi:MAG: PAS domain S-box protein [Rhodoferax sp.]|nr:PAS domain S-box protein [Rhodoferax sp.]
MTSFYSRLSIRNHVILLAITMALPVTVMLAWLQATELQRVRADAYADVRVVADSTAASLVHILRDHENVLSRIAERPLVRRMDAANFDPLMGEIMQIHPEYNNLAVRDVQGNNIYSFRPNPSAPDVARNFPWFQEAVRSEKFVAGDAFLGRLVGRWVSVLTYPVRDGQGKLNGFVNTPLDLFKLNERVFEHLPANAVVAVVDRTGAFLLRSKEPHAYIGKPSTARARQFSAGLREGTISTAGLDGVVRLYSFVTIPGVDWLVVAGLPEDVVFANYRKNLMRTVVGGASVLILMLFMAWRLGSAIVRPITDLADVATRVAGGNTEVRAQPGGPSEVAAVALQFNHMLDVRRQNEDSLQHSEAFSQSILNSVSAEIAVLNHSGVIVAVNEPWQRFALENGLEPGTLAPLTGVGANYLQVCQPIDDTTKDRDAANARSGIQDVLNGTVASFNMEYPCHSPKEQRWFNLSATPLVHDDGGVVVSHTDITQRKLAEEAVREQTETLLAVIHSASDAIISVDAEGLISLFNPAAERIFGYPASTMIGARLERLLPERPRSAHQGHLQGFAHSQVTSRQMGAGRVQGLSADGRMLELEASISQVMVRGRKVLTAILRDVTERVHTEEALKASLREKEALLREVHHRVKNNLQVITSLLRLEVGRSDHAATKSVLTDMRGRIHSMALLHESLYRTGIFAAVDLAGYLKQLATQAFRTLATPTDRIRLQLELDSVQVELDQATPCGLLVNELISNCFKHGFPEGHSGEVRVALHTLPDSAQVRLVVSDTGVGLPSDFEVRRAQSLGLQLVSDLARQLGGALEVGPGSQFAVTFTPQAVHQAVSAEGIK